MYKDNKGINCGLLLRYNRNIIMLLSEYSKRIKAPSKQQSSRETYQITNGTLSRVFEQNSSQSNNIPNPIKRLEQCFPLYPNLLAEVTKQQRKPSRLHTQASPILLKIANLIGNAQMGKGTGLAFLLLALTPIEYQSTPRSEHCAIPDNTSHKDEIEEIQFKQTQVVTEIPSTAVPSSVLSPDDRRYIFA
uniref:Uncharacterized protein n=1 Tax=Glossina pallidipes TaxID=7398 RepID=A0A1A9Z0C4_GLOPL